MSLPPSTRESDPRPTGARSDVRGNGREHDGVKAACYAASVPARMTEVIVAGAQWCRWKNARAGRWFRLTETR